LVRGLVLVERERFRQLRLHALEALCRRLTGDGLHAEAVDAGIAAIAAEPLRESAHRALMSAHVAEGNRGEAMRQTSSAATCCVASSGSHLPPRWSS
jgi:DNA-binding SARP family transcriptional activator